MQYPICIFSEYKIAGNPNFYKTCNGDEYCIFTIYKSFNTKSYVKDSSLIQCYGDEVLNIKRLLEKYHTLKNYPVDVIAERQPYMDDKKNLTYSYKAIKVSIASSFYQCQEGTVSNNNHSSQSNLSTLEKMEKDPFNTWIAG